MKLSDVIKLQLLKYYRFERSFDYVCTEGIHNSEKFEDYSIDAEVPF